MANSSIKVPDTLDSRLAEKAQRRRTSNSTVVREWKLASRKVRAASCLNSADGFKGPRDIATDPKYLEEQDTTFIGEIFSRAAEDVQEADAIKPNKYARQLKTLHAWQSTSRGERAPLRGEKNQD